MSKFRKLAPIMILAIALVSSCGGGGGSGEDGVSDPTIATFSTGDFSAVNLSQSTVGSEGGTITSPDISGFEIKVPAGAVDADETITFSVRQATVDSSGGLPDDLVVGNTMYQVETSGSDNWNVYRMFNLATKFTLPYTAPESGQDIPSFYVYNSDGTLEPTGFADIDKTNGTITFYIRTFANSGETADFSASIYDPIKASQAASQAYANFVNIGTAGFLSSWLTNGATMDTAFRAANDGWYIPNYGSFYAPSRGGNCYGMASFAKYYFRAFGSGLRAKYHDADDTATWVDDATAIQLASRVQGSEMALWNQFTGNEFSVQTPSSRDVALSLLGGLYVTKQPVLMYTEQNVQNTSGTWTSSGEHTLLTYKAVVSTNGVITFSVYDSNYPNDDTRTVQFAEGIGFFNYGNGTTAANSTLDYNFFYHMGYYTGISDNALKALKESADKNFTGDSVFPIVTIDSITGQTTSEDVMANTGTTSNGESKYITSDTAITISGTVLGGRAQSAGSVVDNINLITSSGTTTTSVDNQAGGGTGAFSTTIPISPGENEVVFLASDSNDSLAYWAAYDRIIVESTATTQSLKITLTWGEGDSDVDLYVREPNFTDNGVNYTGDTVYYNHRRVVSIINPYLDFDNRTGYGPEHYIAEEGMSTLANNWTTENPDGVYGAYTYKVHYFKDYSEGSGTQPITWTVNYEYLAYCEDPCSDPKVDGFWVTGSSNGAILIDDADNCCDIDNTGGDWSSAYEIEYPIPNAADWVIPDSQDAMLP